MSRKDKPSRRRRIYFAFGLFVFLAYFLPLGILYTLQRHMTYLPHTKEVGEPSSYGVPQMKVVEVHTEDGLTLHDWFAPPKKKDDIVIVLFHGHFLFSFSSSSASRSSTSAHPCSHETRSGVDFGRE